jgi:hypothetical protein
VRLKPKLIADECSTRLIEEQERQDIMYCYKDGYLEKGTMELEGQKQLLTCGHQGLFVCLQSRPCH